MPEGGDQEQDQVTEPEEEKDQGTDVYFMFTGGRTISLNVILY